MSVRRPYRGSPPSPILDLQLSVDDIDLRTRLVGPLELLGYLFGPAPESPDYRFFAKPPERPRTYHLHMSAGPEASTSSATSPSATSCAATPRRRHGYAAHKRHLVARHPQDRLADIEGKHGYVTVLERRA